MTEQPPSAKITRQKRLAAALRANLKRRKAAGKTTPPAEKPSGSGANRDEDAARRS